MENYKENLLSSSFYWRLFILKKTHKELMYVYQIRLNNFCWKKL